MNRWAVLPSKMVHLCCGRLHVGSSNTPLRSHSTARHLHRPAGTARCRALQPLPLPLRPSEPLGIPLGLQTLDNVGSGIGHSGNAYFVEGIQKAVYRVPIDSMAVPKPLHMTPLPPVVAKAIAGYVTGGWLGMARTLLFSK